MASFRQSAAVALIFVSLLSTTLAGKSMSAAKRSSLQVASKQSAVCHHLVQRYGQVYFLQKPVCKVLRNYEKTYSLLAHNPPLKSGIFIRPGPNAVPCGFINSIGRINKTLAVNKQLVSSMSVAINHVQAGYLKKSFALEKQIEASRGEKGTEFELVFPTLLHKAGKLSSGLKKLMADLGEDAPAVDNAVDACTHAKARRAPGSKPIRPPSVAVRELRIHGSLKSYCNTLTVLEQTLHAKIKLACYRNTAAL